jgi:hypothetical protein
LDFDKIDWLLNERYLTKRKHPTLPLWILNYSAKCQYEPYWTPETLACRGLVVDEQNQIVARGLPKFFNHDEIHKFPALSEQFGQHILGGDPVVVTEKMDGSLILVFTWEGNTVVATRGRFDSPQAHMAREILDRKYPECGWAGNGTYLFELIHPENRIVVNYGGTADLYHLAALNGVTGEEIPRIHTAFPRPKEYVCGNWFEVMDHAPESNAEGLVARFPSGLRVKIKWEEYKRLHRLLTGVSPKTIWEELAAGRDLAPMLERVPDEWFQWVKAVQGDLEDKFADILVDSARSLAWAQAQGFTERREYASYFKGCRCPAACFLLLDDRDPASVIWKQIKPESSPVFRCGES